MSNWAELNDKSLEEKVAWLADQLAALLLRVEALETNRPEGTNGDK